jgi:DNA-binding winged helix-turn-helix (wHTH) protein
MAATSKHAIASYLFDDVEVDFATLRVQKGGSTRKLTPRAFEVLVYLLEHRGRTIEKQELFEQVWKDRIVSDNALTRIIKEIRQVIGDDANAPRYIETVPKVGFRFLPIVIECSDQCSELVLETHDRLRIISNEEETISDDEPLNEVQKPRAVAAPLQSVTGNLHLSAFHLRS